jgi:hypothetical protein
MIPKNYSNWRWVSYCGDATVSRKRATDEFDVAGGQEGEAHSRNPGQSERPKALNSTEDAHLKSVSIFEEDSIFDNEAVGDA